MKATVNGVTKRGNDLLVEREDYWFVCKILKLNEDGEVIGQYEPQVLGDKWSVEITFDSDSAKLAFSLTMLPKNVEDNSADSVQELADKALAEGTNLNIVLANVKQFWDETLAKVPAPQNFGVEGNKKMEILPVKIIEELSTLHGYFACRTLLNRHLKMDTIIIR